MRWAALIGLLAVHVGASSTPLSIGLETGWPAPHPIHELLETVYADTPGYYLNWLTTLTSLGRPRVNEAQSDKEARDIAFDLIDSYGLRLDDLSKSIYKLALGMHISAPRLEAQYSWYERNVDEAKLGVEGCGSWVEWRGKGFCDHKALDDDVQRSIEDGIHHDSTSIVELPFDRTSFPDDGPVRRQAILYYDPDSDQTERLLMALQFYGSNPPSFGFVVRNKPPKWRRTSVKRTGVSGYGVELALKNTDYLVVDDRASTPASTGRATTSGASSHEYFRDTLGDDPWSELSTPLTKEELRELGLKAASLIMSSEDKLDALQHLAQDFPKYSAALSRHVRVSETVKAKLQDLYNMGPMEPAVYLNGKPFGGADLNAFSLLKAIRDEKDLIASLTRLGLSSKQAYELISDSVIGQAQTEEDPADGTVDASDKLEDGNAITWWNDIEKDSRYKSWPKGIRGYLRPIYPGQLHTIRHNTWNLVFVLDLSSAPSLDVIASSITTMIQRGLPLRFGIVPMITEGDDDLSLLMAKVFFYSVKTLGRASTKEMLDQIVANTPSTPASPGIVQLDTVRQAYELAASRSKKPALPFEEMLSQSDFDERLNANFKYTSRIMATKEDSASGHLFINGKHVPMSGQWLTFVQQELTNQLQFLAEQIGHGAEIEDMSRAFYDLPTTTARRSKYLLPGLTENKLKVFSIPKLMSSMPAQIASKDFIYTPDRTRGTPITIWIIGDLDSVAGRALIDDALTHQQTPDSASRIGFLHFPTSGSEQSGELRFSTLLYTLLTESSLQTLHPAQLQTILREFDNIKSNLDADGNILSDEAQVAFQGTPLHAFSSAGWSAADAVAASKFWDGLAKDLRPALGLRSTLPHLLINGRLVGPLKPGSFFVEDFDLFELYELRKRTKPVIDVLKTMYEDLTKFDRATLADLISSASSIIAASYAPSEADGIFTPPPVGRNRYFERIDKERAMSFSIGDSDTALLHVTAVIDPISEQAQKWSSLLQTLRHLDHVAVSVYLQPQPVMLDLKVKRFYRFALSHEAQYDVDGNEVAPQVTFNDLPGSPILTLAMDTPPSWVVRPESSPHDLDNLVLGNDQEPIHITFNLNQLLIEGHAREANNAPPRGLQLQLTDKSGSAISDTSVMANLGYFQFKATPGVYQLAIRPGRGREVYEMESVGTRGWDSLGVNVTGTSVALTSFEGATILPRFERKKGMEMENVLIEAATAQALSVVGSVFTRMKQIVGLEPAPAVSAVKTRHADINIFTVASGLLYERFASIMILSVMKNTQSTVKFWFIENFLSPTFLEFVPRMAEEYGFEYEFVTYKWPHWLRAQTEKQRIIWAYKILFLDVLFPMDLDKVIFVDADQIVRVDMKELVDLDLHGHVYGYPPMGDDRTEMEGFRFWKTGYWKDALRGRPYHISALYVVDLKRFRQLATGDRLRGQYHALSADPNSLANLDQDLPNSMQDQIPIFTLDQDWLWCQTWCSDESLATAKTIDLCQNPLTKEPKLKRARQIPEWDVYDREIANFAARISGNQGALAASVDDLAGVKSAETSEPEADVDGGAGSEVDQVNEEEDKEHARRIDDEL